MRLDDVFENVRIALLELRVREGTSEFARGFRGAFVTVLVRCRTDAEYFAHATPLLFAEGFDILSVEDLSSVADGRFQMSEEIATLAARTEQYPVQWTSFHLYRDLDSGAPANETPGVGLQ